MPNSRDGSGRCFFCWLFLFFVLGTGLASASKNHQQEDVDRLFRRARAAAQQGDIPQAQQICRGILERAPDYTDVRVYLGRLFLWQQDYAAARPEFARVLEQEPGHLGALEGLIDTELWSDLPESALRVCLEGLRFRPRSPELLWRKARIHYLMQDYSQTAETLRDLLAQDPEHAEARRLYPLVQSSTRLVDLSQTYRLELLGRTQGEQRAWHFFSLEAVSHVRWGTLQGRLNHTVRDYGEGAVKGTQLELESYPLFSERFYAHLQAGISPSRIFPRLRLGGELYANLPSAFEVSAGARYMDFRGSQALVFTGSLGKYYRNYWFSFRPSFSSESAGSALSGLLWVRRYFRSADEYWGFLVGLGSTPVDLYFLEDIQRTNSFRIGLEIKRPLSRILVFRGHLRYEREEYLPQAFGNRFVFDLRLEERIFKKY